MEPCQPNNLESSDYFWLINGSAIAPGASAIIGNNHIAFFGIHHTALCTITISLVASLIVIINIHKKWQKCKSKLDLPVRFPLYLAIADLLWGISHFSDHMYLVTVQKYPEFSGVKLALSMNLWFFFGYQQMMHASVAGYTYLRVVHRKKLNLGKWEWKLHLLWCCFLLTAILIFYLTDSFGNTGYWMLQDATTINGQILGVVIALTSTSNAICTTLGYYSIKRTVVNLKNNLQSHRRATLTFDGDGNPVKTGDSLARARPHDSIASRCLTTYVNIASYLYCPLALLFWINVLFQIFMGVIETFSCLLMVILANSSGWANAYGYFHNEKLKKKNAKERLANLTIEKNSTTDNNYSGHTGSTDV